MTREREIVRLAAAKTRLNGDRAMSEKMFRITKPGTDEDVFGGLIPRDNCYLRTYGKRLPGEKPLDDLEIGEGCLVKYNLSGSKGTYKIARVE
jgi:hypothetical protein